MAFVALGTTIEETLEINSIGQEANRNRQRKRSVDPKRCLECAKNKRGKPKRELNGDERKGKKKM